MTDETLAAWKAEVKESNRPLAWHFDRLCSIALDLWKVDSIDLHMCDGAVKLQYDGLLSNWRVSWRRLQPFVQAALASAPALPTAEADELRAASLEERMKAAGMLSLADLLSGKTPIERWMAHTSVRDIPSFQAWLQRRHEDFLRMQVGYDLGDKPKDDELYEWVLAHVAAFGEVSSNLRAALATTPETAKPDTSAADGLRLKALLNGRDAFIVNEGLWSKFVATLPQKAAPATASSGGMVRAVGWAYRESKWGDPERWHLCSDKPSERPGRDVQALYLASAIEALSKQAAPPSANRRTRAMDKPDVRALAEDVPPLKPCPFCGEFAVVWRLPSSGEFRAGCNIGCAESSWQETDAEARAWWNQRAKDDRRATRETAKAEGRRQGLEEAALLAEAQSFYPDTHTGTRQQWVKDQIAASIRAIAQTAEG